MFLYFAIFIFILIIEKRSSYRFWNWIANCHPTSWLLWTENLEKCVLSFKFPYCRYNISLLNKIHKYNYDLEFTQIHAQHEKGNIKMAQFAYNDNNNRNIKCRMSFCSRIHLIFGYWYARRHHQQLSYTFVSSPLWFIFDLHGLKFDVIIIIFIMEIQVFRMRKTTIFLQIVYFRTNSMNKLSKWSFFLNFLFIFHIIFGINFIRLSVFFIIFQVDT